MRIERLQVGAFGRLRDFDSGPEPLAGLVVVVGPNEAGKSTLFHFLTSMMYGFSPASRDGNPYAPWDGAEPSGSVTLRLDTGGCATVERRLLSQPVGRLESGGGVEDLRNRPLPWAEHVPRAVFRQVFAVTLSEMASLDEDTWARVQDRILGSMGSSDLRPARLVVADLEQEAAEIWRPNRRGNQRARDLVAELPRLRARRRDALEGDRRLRALTGELERVRQDLQETREARHAALMAVERVQGLIPIRAQLLRIAALREDAGEPSCLDAFPPDPGGEMEALAARAAALRRKLEELALERGEPQAALDAFGTLEERLLRNAEAIQAFLARNASRASDRDRLSALQQETRDLRRRLDGAAAQILTDPLDEILEDAVARVPVAELRERIRGFREAREARRRRAEATLRDPAPERPSPPLVAALAVLLSGLVLAGVGMGSGSRLASAAGAVVSALGLFLGYQWHRGRKEVRPEGAVEAPEAPDVQEGGARSRVEEVVAALPVNPSLLAEPTEALSAGLERAQELVRDLRERTVAAQETEARLDALDAEAADLSSTLERGGGLDAPALAHLLDRDLRQAERMAERAEAAEREMTRLSREEERTRDSLAETEAALAALRTRLEDAGSGDLERGLRSVRDRLQARDRADQLEDELRHAHADLEEIRTRIRAAEERGESWTVDEGDLPRRKAAVEELTLRVETLATRAESLDKDIEALRATETVAAVDGAMAALEAEERALLAERDRRWIMAQLVREADRRFREEHQPDVLRRAGEHLRFLTGGRYDRLVVDESAANRPFQLLGPGLPAPVPLSQPISTGTLEQAYLALRLAIVDHLDQGLERLPLFVDEVFVNWDVSRRGRGMSLLGELALHRQIFVFTCHTNVAEALRAEGATVLDLAPDG